MAGREALLLTGRRTAAGTSGLSYAKGQYDFNWSVVAVQPSSPFFGDLQVRRGGGEQIKT